MADVELTSISEVRQYMQKSLSDKLQDADIETLIGEASGEIQRQCNREFAPPSPPKTRSFEFEPNNGFDLIDLTPFEYRVVEEVTLDPDITPKVLLAAEYRSYPYPSREGTFFGLRFTELDPPVLPKGFPSSQSFPYQTRRVDVKARWGMLEVPEGVRHFTNVVVAAWADLRLGRPAEIEGVPIQGYDIPPPAFFGLKRWMRPTAAV